jgi:hypothetical protein
VVADVALPQMRREHVDTSARVTGERPATHAWKLGSKSVRSDIESIFKRGTP